MKKLLNLAIILVLGVGVSACMGPAKVETLFEIAANQTCFNIPLVGASKDDQAKFMSEDFLNEAKIATKRITIPVVEHNTGRMWYDYEWVPAIKVICVDRTPVTREWTSTEGTGTANSNQSIAVESIESINFGVGVTATGVVTEKDAATFQYWYAGKPLADVMDQNVRGFIVSYLSREFGKITLDDARKEKANVFDGLSKAATEEFKSKGITLTNIGSSEGLNYSDDGVQDSINKAWTAQRDRERAGVEKETAVIKAQQEKEVNVITAEGEAEANKKRQIALTPDILKKMAIEKWDGKLPLYNGSGVNAMLNLTN